MFKMCGKRRENTEISSQQNSKNCFHLNENVLTSIYKDNNEQTEI